MDDNTDLTLSLLQLLRLQWNPKLLWHIFFGRLFLRILNWHRHSYKSLGLAYGSAFLQLHNVANLELVIRVMSLVLLLLPDPPLVLGVRR